MEYIRQLNWIDILALIVLFRVSYISVKTGFPIELFKLFGTVFAIFFACHYYFRLGTFFLNRTPLEGEFLLRVFSLFAFIIIATSGYLIVMLIRRFITALIKMEAVSSLNRWGALTLGLVRALFLCSLLFFIFMISNIRYLNNRTADSLLGSRLFRVTPATYEVLWNSLAARLIDSKAFNGRVLDVGRMLEE